MPNNARIFPNNLSLGTAATISVSAAAVSLPGTNLINLNRRKVWRTPTGTKIGTAVIDLGTTYDVTGFGLISSNIGTSGTVTIQANASDSWGAPSYDSGAQAAYESSFSGVLLWFFAAKTFRYWRIILDDPSNPSNYVEAGIAWIGTYVELERNFRYGWQVEVVPLSNIDYAVDGTPYTDELGEYRNIVIDVGFLSEDFAINTFLPMMRRIATKKDVLISLFPQRGTAEGTAAEQKLTFYGRLQAPSIRNTSSQRWGISMTLRESP